MVTQEVGFVEFVADCAVTQAACVEAGTGETVGDGTGLAEGTADIQEVLGSLVTLNTSLQTGAVETLSQSAEFTVQVGVVDVVVF